MFEPKNSEDIESIKKSREIVKEILDFGINQFEMQKIIQLLSYELEDRDLMKEINNLLNKDKTNEVTENKLVL
jgi:hypothetical protein